MKQNKRILFILTSFMISVSIVKVLWAGTVHAQEKAISISNTLAVGDTFTVSNITYRVSSVTGTLEVHAISAPMRLTTITIPGSVIYEGASYQVVSIPKGAFYGNYKTTKIVISEGVKTVGSNAFQRCDAVKELELPSTLESFTTIGFKNLETIRLASGNTHFQLKNGVLFTKDGSKLWLYPSGKSGTSYTVPAGTKTIGGSSFYQNQNLQTIELASSVTSVENCAFYQLNDLVSITFGSNVSSVGDHNLKYCPNLKSIVLKNSGKLGSYCVYECESLESITINGNLSGYGAYTFYKLPNLKRYEVKQSPYYSDEDGVLYNKSQLLRYPSAKTNEQYIVPDGTTKIAGLAFNYGQHLKEVILNPGVYVDLLAFQYPNTSSAISIYFRDKESVSLSKSSSGVFVGLKEHSNIYLPTDAAVNSFQSYSKAVSSKTTVTVSKKTIPSTGLKLNKTEVELKKGETVTLTGALTPTYTTDDISWVSEDPKVATVSSAGVVTAVTSGTCKITAKTDSGLIKSCSVTVSKTKAPDSTSSETGDVIKQEEKEDIQNTEVETEEKPDSQTDDITSNSNHDTPGKDETKSDEQNASSNSDTQEETETQTENNNFIDKYINIFSDDNNASDTSKGDLLTTKSYKRSAMRRCIYLSGALLVAIAIAFVFIKRRCKRKR